MPHSLSPVYSCSTSFEALDIVTADIEKMMGFAGGASPEPFSSLTEQAIAEGPRIFTPGAGYSLVPDIEFDTPLRQFRAGKHLFSPGKTIFNQIRHAEALLFFVTTAGEAVSQRCLELNRAGDTIYSYVLDTLGTVVAEKTLEKMMLMLESQLPSGWHLSESYSPGYCNWDVAQQQMLFSFFPPGFCGVTLSPSSLMHPVKSVSGLIGLGPGLNRKGYHCDICNDKTCIYRRIRNTTP